jgi:2-methylcitrate dehydratase PrpD
MAGDLSTASSRAFAWGGLGNILEMDDVDKRALLHPGPSVVPAALAMADEIGAPGEALLAALVIGYEATIRLGRAVGAGHYALFHNTGTCGPIGAAAACAALLELPEEESAHAMSLAVSQAAGLWQTRHEASSMGKQLHTAHAARAGYDAARLAARGFMGPLTIIEGAQGFFAALCPGGSPRDVVSEGDGWAIHDVSFKPWPACRHAHAAIDAALLMRQKHHAASDAKVTLSTYADALKFCDRPDPRTVIEAKFSLQHAVAVTWARGAPTLDDFSPAAIADPGIKALRRRIAVETEPRFENAYPAHFGACLEIDGDVFEVPDALGDPENPVGRELIAGKAGILIAASPFASAGNPAAAVLDGRVAPSKLAAWLSGERA